MATGGEMPGRLPSTAGYEILSQRICQPCLDNDNLLVATGLCVDCQDYLCLNCFNDHKVHEHQLLNREQLLQAQAQGKPNDSCSDSCSVHYNEVIEYYCVSHGHLGCKLCILSIHAACDKIHYIPYVSKEFVNNEDYVQAEIHLKSVLDTFVTAFRNVQRNSDEVDKSCADALEELHNFKRQIDEILEDMERKLVEKAKTLRLKATQTLAEVRIANSRAHDELQSSLAKIEVLQSANQNCSSFLEMMKTKQKIKSLEDQTQEAEMDISYRQSPIRFTPNGELLELLSNPGCFGTVSSADALNVLTGSGEVPGLSDKESSSSDDFSVITDTGSRISHPSLRTGPILSWLHTVSNLHDPNTEVVSSGLEFGARDLKVKTGRDMFDCGITGMVMLPESRLVLTDFDNSSIKEVDVKTGQVVAQLQLNARPWDITSIEKDKVAVTMPGRKALAFVSVRDYNLSIERTLTVDGECSGVDYRNSKLAVSYRKPNKVQIMNVHGDMMHTISGDTSGESLFNYPLYLVFGQDDKIVYVSNYLENNVICVNMDRTVVGTYRDIDIRRPRKAAVDNSGNVYVCAEGSNTVHQFTKNCMKLQVLLTHADGLDRPRSICLGEEEDKLYVGMWDSDCVKVYSIGRNEYQ